MATTDKEYMTVREYADAIGISAQAVYYKLKTDSKFKAKTVKTGKQTLIEKSAVADAAEFFLLSNFNKTLDKSFTDLQKLNQTLTGQIAAKDQEIDRLHAENDRLYTEIDRLHAESDTLHQEIATLHGEIERLHQESDKLHGEITMLHELLNQQQQLNLLDKQKIQQLEAPGAGRRKRRWRNRE